VTSHPFRPSPRLISIGARSSTRSWRSGSCRQAAAIAYPVARFLIPPASGEPATQTAVAGRVGKLGLNTAAIFKFGSKPGIVVRTAEGEIRAFSAVCTHLDCTVQFKTTPRNSGARATTAPTTWAAPSSRVRHREASSSSS
jgi:Rieske Fe-S protein